MTTYTPSSDNVMFGRGRVFFSQFVSNAFNNQFIHLGNCDTFSISVAPEFATLTDFTTETSVEYKKVAKATSLTMKIAGFEFATKNLQYMFLGDLTSYTQTLATITGETIASAAVTGLKGAFFPTTYRSISSPVLTQGATTLVSGTDYEIHDASKGVIRILPTGSTVADGTALLLTYVKAAISTPLSIVRGATQTAMQGRVMFLPNNTTGPNNEVIAWNVNLSPDGDVGFIADDFAKWSVTGAVQSDSAGTYGGSSSDPYFQITTR